MVKWLTMKDIKNYIIKTKEEAIKQLSFLETFEKELKEINETQ